MEKNNRCPIICAATSTGDTINIAFSRQKRPIKGKKNILPLVINDLRARDKVGTKKYGTTLQSNNGRDALVDAYQEALDLVMYLRQTIQERDKI